MKNLNIIYQINVLFLEFINWQIGVSLDIFTELYKKIIEIVIARGYHTTYLEVLSYIDYINI